MARQPKPWKRASNGAWYATVGGKQVRLAEAGAVKAEAHHALAVILAARDAGDRKAVRDGLTFGDAAGLFLDFAAGAVERGELEAVTAAGYVRFLGPAVAAFGKLPLARLRPHHVQAWVDGRKGWGPTTRSHAITAVKRALNWAKRIGHLKENPIADMARPAPHVREAVLSAAQIEELIGAASEPFKTLLEALRETGCRPGEACRLTAAGVDLTGGTWTVLNKSRAKTREQHRTVYLSTRALAISARLVAAHPDGPLFRNRLGRKWTRNAIALRMGRLAGRLGYGPEAVAYSLRHQFITDCLERGVPPATVAELVGHTDLKMIMRVYSKLRDRTDHLRNAVNVARPA